MLENDAEYRGLVEQKMMVRAERNALLRQAEKEAEAVAALEAQAAQERDRLAKQKLAEQVRQRETATQARRQRPALIGKFKANPAGLRNVDTLRRVCLQCGSDRVHSKSASFPFVQVCQDCWAEWHTAVCWSCATGRVDSRDPETAPCSACGWPKCAVCGACRPDGCVTNPYSTTHRYQDAGPNSMREASASQDLPSEA